MQLQTLITSLGSMEPAQLDGVALLAQFHAARPGGLIPPPDHDLEAVRTAAQQLVAYQIACAHLSNTVARMRPVPLQLHQIEFGL